MNWAGQTIILERYVTNLPVWSARRGSDIPDDCAHSLRGEMIKWSEAERDEVRQLASKSSTASSGREIRSYQICRSTIMFTFEPTILLDQLHTIKYAFYNILVTLKLESPKVRSPSVLGSQCKSSSLS